MLKLKRLAIPRVGLNVEKLELSQRTWCDHFGNSFLKQVPIRWPHHSGTMLCSQEKETYVQINTVTQRFTPALFLIVQTWKLSKYPSTDKWINELWCIYTMEYLHSKDNEQWTINTHKNMDESQNNYTRQKVEDTLYTFFCLVGWGPEGKSEKQRES